MDQRASIAVKIIEDAIREIRDKAERDVQELLRAKEAVLKLPKNTSSSDVGADLAGLRLTDAINLVVNNFGGSVSFSSLKESLEKRGARLGDPKKPNRYAANLKTAIVNNPAKFKYNKETDTVSLNRD